MKQNKLPVFDPAKDGNPFWWIVQTANKVRQAREPIRRLGIPNQKKIPPKVFL